MTQLHFPGELGDTIRQRVLPFTLGRAPGWPTEETMAFLEALASGQPHRFAHPAAAWTLVEIAQIPVGAHGMSGTTVELPSVAQPEGRSTLEGTGVSHAA